MATIVPEKLRVLELYSGIGGMHWALKESSVDHDVAMAVDINTTANGIYQHNFLSTCLQSFGLEKLTLRKLESLGINTILMSPPCQPFTRVGKKGDCEDVRTKSFLHILRLLKEIAKKPTYILVENVKGFETSQTRDQLLDCLNYCGYIYQEFLLTPLQFGIPNCRLRYYMIAKHNGHFSFPVQSEILSNLPSVNGDGAQQNDCESRPKTGSISTPSQENSAAQSSTDTSTLNNSANELSEPGTQTQQIITSESAHTEEVSSQTCPNDKSHKQMSSLDSSQRKPESMQEEDSSVRNSSQNNRTTRTDPLNCVIKTSLDELRDAGRNMRYCEEEDEFINEHTRSLSDFMEEGSLADFQDYMLSDKELRLFVIMDIVFPALKKSICFTKRYGHYVEGAGSVVQMSTSVEDTRAASEFKSQVVELKNRSEWGDEELSILRKLQLRYFTPREVANLMCFPQQFSFPDGLTKVQQYRVLGNSLNVNVVAQLIRVMTS